MEKHIYKKRPQVQCDLATLIRGLLDPLPPCIPLRIPLKFGDGARHILTYIMWIYYIGAHLGPITIIFIFCIICPFTGYLQETTFGTPEMSYRNVSLW